MVILDNGHGIETPGKRSPDGVLREWQWNRNIVERIAKVLELKGIDVSILVPEDDDIPLKKRVERANELYAKDKSSFLVSVHVNGTGTQFDNAKGWSCHIDKDASQKSKDLAALLIESAKECLPDTVQRNNGKPVTFIQKYDGKTKTYKKVDLYITKHTKCPAVLTENLFMTNRDECDFLLSEEGKNAIVKLHVKAILKYLDKYK